VGVLAWSVALGCDDVNGRTPGPGGSESDPDAAPREPLPSAGTGAHGHDARRPFELPPDEDEAPPDPREAPPDPREAPPDPREAPPDPREAPPEPDEAPLDAGGGPHAPASGSDAGSATPDGGTQDAGVPVVSDPLPDAGPNGDAGSGPAPGWPRLDTSLNVDDAALNVHVEADGVSAEWYGLSIGGVRSTRAIAPGQGVFYYEAQLWDVFDAFTIGLATAAAPLDQNAGANDQSFGVDPSGNVYANGFAGRFARGSANFGFVLDYRAATPIVHVIAAVADRPALVHSQRLDAIRAPLFIYLAGLRRTTETHLTINPGNDTVNAPFVFDPVEVLRAAGLADTATALVRGWGYSHAGVWNEPPSLYAPTGTTVAVGTQVTLEARATDAEDGPLDAKILWEVLSTGYGPERVQGTGRSFTFTPRLLGIHPVRVTVEDDGGKRAGALLDVRALGELPQYEDVRLEPDAKSGSGVVVSNDGLRVRWTVEAKNAIRANQALYGAFWYFEARRLIAPANQAPGLVIGDVWLDPLRFNVAPPSCSVQTSSGGIFQNLIYRAQSPYAADAIEYYGFAVDYRGRYPLVHVLLGHRVHTLHLTDATVPIHPMLYGNPTYTGAEWDLAINFGGTPFHYDPEATLRTAGIDASDLVPCWGAANRACRHLR
jgi:hypothetical protein